METKTVPVTQRVEQVQNGSHYRGYVEINGTRFDYELEFTVPLSRIDNIELPKEEAEIRKLFKFVVRSQGKEIELTYEEWGFFFSMISPVIVDFYNNPQTQDTNEGPLGNLLRGRGYLAASGVAASIAMTSNATYDLSLNLCAMLNAPKFNCKIAV